MGSVGGMDLKLYTIDGRGEPTRLLLLIHGYGANEFHLASFGPLIDPGRSFLVAAPRGPMLLPPDGAAWWDIDVETFDFDYALLPASLAALDRLVDDVCADRGYERSQAVIGGFSQGAALALALGFQRSDKPRPAGVLCMSGVLLDAELVDWDLEAGRDVAVLVQHGDRDPFLPPARATEVAETLRAAGVDVEQHTYDMEHDIVLAGLQDAAAWLARH